MSNRQWIVDSIFKDFKKKRETRFQSVGAGVRKNQIRFHLHENNPDSLECNWYVIRFYDSGDKGEIVGSKVQGLDPVGR